MFGRINMAILGTGGIAETMAKTISGLSGVTAYAVASRDEERAAVFAKKNGFKKSYGSYEALVKDRKVDLVYIATPHSEHFENAKLCIKNGKNVLCEKAFTLRESEAKELFSLADEKNVLITEAMWIRYMPFYKTIMEVLNSKVIGEPVSLTANLGYNVREIKRLTDPKLGGGALLDLGVYTLNFASMIFGNEIKSIEPSCIYTDTGVDEQDTFTIHYKDGRIASLMVTMDAMTDRMGCIHGTKGCMVIENINNFESLTVYNSNHNKIGYYKRPKQKTGYEYEVLSAVKAIKNGYKECPDMPHEMTLEIMREMDEIRRKLHIYYPGDPEYKQQYSGSIEDEKTSTAVDSGTLQETVPGTSPETDDTTAKSTDTGMASDHPSPATSDPANPDMLQTENDPARTETAPAAEGLSVTEQE